jgi:hypothetical protein
MSDPRTGGWLSGLVLGGVSGLALLVLGTLGLVFGLLSLGLILWRGPRGLAGAGLLTGLGLIWTVLFARVALTCGGPFDPGVGTCGAPDLGGWIATSVAMFAVGLVASAFALRRSRR